jgi:hypothetical protein
MAFVFIQEPEGITQELYDKVNEKLGVRDNPPAGLIVHTAGNDNGTWKIVDVWESREARDRFGEERLMPAVAEVMRENGQDPPSGPPALTAYEAYDLVTP